MIRKISICFLFFLTIGGQHVWANPDSVLAIVNQQKEPKEKLYTLKIAIEKFKDTNSSQVLNYGKLAYRLSKKEVQPDILAEGLRLLGYSHFINFNYDSAIFYLKSGYNLVQNDQKINYFLLLNLGDAYWYKGDFDSCLYYHEIAEVSVRVMNNPTELANITTNIADYYRQKGNFKKALEVYDKAIEYALLDSTGKILPKVYHNTALTYFHLGDSYTELDYYFKAVEASTKYSQSKNIGLHYCNIAKTYSTLGQHKKAIDFAQKGINLATKYKQLRQLVHCYNMLGTIYLTIDSLQLSERAYLESIRLNKVVMDKRLIARNLGCMGKIEFLKGDLQKAMKYYEDAINMQDSIGEKKYKIYDLIGLARTHIKLNNNKLAEKYKNEAQNLSVDLNIPEGMAESYLLTSDLYTKSGNHQLALVYYKKYDSLGNLMEKEDRERYLTNLEKLQESKVKELENFRLKQGIEQQAIIIERGKYLVFIGVVAVLSLTIISIFIFWLLKKNQASKKLISLQNEALTKKHIEIQAMSEQQENLLHLVVHDLKSPLNKIEGLVSILKLEGELNTNQKDVVRMLEQISKKGKEFISDLLGASQIEYRSKETKKEFFDLNELIEEVKEEFSVQAEKKGISITLEADYIEQSVFTDKELLYHIIANLLSNAIKFSGLNKRVEIVSRCRNQIITISIKDQGQGFSGKDKENLFQKFQRLSAQPTASEGSTGLGLFLTKTLVDSLKGEINLESQEGNGATFIIVFPNFFDTI